MSVIRISKCLINFPQFLTDYVKPDGTHTGKFGCRLILDNKINSVEIDVINEFIGRHKAFALGRALPESFEGQRILKNFKAYFHNGDTDGTPYNFGKHYFTAKNDFRPPLFDSIGNRLYDGDYNLLKPYSVVNVQVEMNFIDSKDIGKIIYFVLDGIQFLYQGAMPKVIKLPKPDIAFEDVSKTMLQNQASIGVTEEQLNYDTSSEFNHALEQTLSS